MQFVTFLSKVFLNEKKYLYNNLLNCCFICSVVFENFSIWYHSILSLVDSLQFNSFSSLLQTWVRWTLLAQRKLLLSILIFIALTNRVVNKFTGALVTISIGRAVIAIWNYVWKFWYRACHHCIQKNTTLRRYW